MTFSILAACVETGELGYVHATSTPAVGERLAGIVRGRGVATVQAAGDALLREQSLRMLEFGYHPDKIVKELAEDRYAANRQFAVVDSLGRVAVSTGADAWNWAGEVVGEHFVATGNTIVGPEVVQAMADAFRDSAGEDFAERLIISLEAGRDAGGQADGQCSSAISVSDHRQSTLNLRVDVHPEPIGELRRIHDWYKVLRPGYVSYGLDPLSWDLDSWKGLHEAGSPFYPDGGGWTPEVVEERTKTILAAAAAAAEEESK
ncbi:DUF1028 domain-containing protein [Streptomyces sp. NPDC060065]|uniref:DUF1028 domain-containing protein n=1 Tax=Streptomyces sp. NPDC060065 TaxID=3347050 RepID=UPI0036A2E0AF